MGTDIACRAGAGASGRSLYSGFRSVLGVAVILACALAAVVHPSFASAAGPSYVALGDSYTITGPPPYDEEVPQCFKSAASYPFLVAKALSLSLNDVACGAAKIASFTTEQYPGVAPQFAALNASTEIVTVSIGGNDAAIPISNPQGTFAMILETCTGLDYSNPLAKDAPCKTAIGGIVSEETSEDAAEIVTALIEIHALAPSAKVFVLGYPKILPNHGTCPASLPWTAGDYKWFNQVQKSLNAILKSGAKSDGATFVNTTPASIGHDLCQPIGVRWIEPLFGNVEPFVVHPNALGQEHDAYDVERAMLNAGVQR
jgi:hypothetical protein